MRTMIANTYASPNVALASVQIAPSNSKRLGLILYNNGSNSCYVNFKKDASSALCSIIIPSFTSWIWNLPDCMYVGPISAIRNAGSGTIIITEFLA